MEATGSGFQDRAVYLLKEALETQRQNAVIFVEDFKMNFISKRNFVSTNFKKGEIKSLPKGATSLTLHLASDSEIGIRTRKRIPATKISPTQI
jgi:GTP pyrophosphokinase